MGSYVSSCFYSVHIYIKYKIKKQGEKAMLKIDAVVGNPPYNSRVDIEFFVKAHELTSRFIMFIHPSKWRSVMLEENAIYMQRVAFEERHLKHIAFFESDGHARSAVWNNVKTGGINYWLMDLETAFDSINVMYKFNGEELDEPMQEYQFNLDRLKTFPYLLTNESIQGIVEKVISSENFKPIIDKFEDTQAGEVYVGNTLFRAFNEQEHTDDSRLKGFSLAELDSLNNYLRTPFWRAITRQLKTGFHSYSVEIFKYIPNFDFENTEITEEYLEDLFGLDEKEREYLKNYRSDICALP